MHTLRLALVAIATLFAIPGQGQTTLISVPLQKLLHIFINTHYAASVKIGDQSFLLVFDTSSCNVIVASRECVGGSCNCDSVERYYNPDAEVLSPECKQVSFFDFGNATGKAIEVSLSIANVTSSHQGVVLADEVTNEWCTISVDGVAGMGAPNCKNPFNLATLFTNIADENNISKVFSFHHGRYPNGEHYGGLILGGSDSRFVKGNFTYVRTIDDDSWKFKIDSVKIGNTKVVPKDNGVIVGLIDTSKSIVLAPEDMVNQIYSSIGCQNAVRGHEKLCVVGCEQIVSLPQLIFTIGGRDFNISSEYYVQESGNLCYVGVQQSSLDFWMIGDYFIDHYYSEFNAVKKSMGFATAIESL